MVRWFLAAAFAVAVSGCGGGGSDTVAGAIGHALAPQSASLATVTATPPDDRAAVRFLEQATFGPTPADIAHLKSVGYDAWLNEQFAARPTYLSAGERTSLDMLQAAWFHAALTAPDQLRQRVAFALWQVMVVSDQKLDSRVALANYHKVLVGDAFGNYRQLLKDVTLSPAMGTYLDMANNVKADPGAGTSPNENYAREVMQLFSIGLVKLNPDGTPLLDGASKTIPAYSQETVEGFAHVFTGWTYPSKKRSSDLNSPYYVGAMQLRAQYHQDGTKELLDGVTVSSDANSELEAAMTSIASHPNVGPFIGVHLIQALVKSNPSPAYVQRVAAAFADNGSGVRGDMKAVIRAVLLDPEARAGDTQPAAATDGKLREPVLYMTRLLRAFAAKSTGNGLQYYSRDMRQDVFSAPSVFNFYPPSYKPQGYPLYGPEFKLLNSPSIASRLNFAYDLTNGGLPGRTTLTFTPLYSVAGDNDKLIAALDRALMHGAMPSSLKSSIASALASAGDDNKERAMLALYLVAASPAFNIQQ